MKKLKISLISSVVLLLFGAFSWEPMGQARKENQIPPLIKKVVNSKGWVFPSVGRTAKTETGTYDVDGLPVTLVLCSFEDSPLFDFSTYRLLTDGTLMTDQTSMTALSMISYRAGDREFGRKANYVPAVLQDGVVVTSPVILSVYYVDEDGDGLFETIYLNAAWVGPAPSWAIPGWVRAKQ
jgi:hypothetical protein